MGQFVTTEMISSQIDDVIGRSPTQTESALHARPADRFDTASGPVAGHDWELTPGWFLPRATGRQRSA